MVGEFSQRISIISSEKNGSDLGGVGSLLARLQDQPSVSAPPELKTEFPSSALNSPSGADLIKMNSPLREEE